MKDVKGFGSVAVRFYESRLRVFKSVVVSEIDREGATREDDPSRKCQCFFSATARVWHFRFGGTRMRESVRNLKPVDQSSNRSEEYASRHRNYLNLWIKAVLKMRADQVKINSSAG